TNEVVLAEMDPRVGGRYRLGMRSADGEQHDVSGEFREGVENRKLGFTFAWGSAAERQSLGTVEVVPAGEAAAPTPTHEHFFDEAARDRHRQGWTASLDKLAAFVG